VLNVVVDHGGSPLTQGRSAQHATLRHREPLPRPALIR
jgi:hypothetical protein